MAKNQSEFPCTAGKHITQRGPNSFRVVITEKSNGVRRVLFTASYPTLSEAQVFRDTKLSSIATDPDVIKTYKALAEKKRNKDFTFGDAIELYRSTVSAKKAGAMRNIEMQADAIADITNAINGRKISVVLDDPEVSTRIKSIINRIITNIVNKSDLRPFQCHGESLRYAKRMKRAVVSESLTIQSIKTEIEEMDFGHDKEAASLDKLARSPFADRALYSFDDSTVLELLDWIKTSGKLVRVKGGTAIKQIETKEDTLRRYLILIRHIFEVMKDEKKIKHNPCGDIPKSKIPKDSASRNIRLQGDQYEQLCKHLEGQPLAYFLLKVETAPRRGELLLLRWTQVCIYDCIIELKATNTKTNEMRPVPLSTKSLEALKSLPRFKHDNRVFTMTAKQFRTAWLAACKAIGAPHLREHDLRHEGTSRLIERGNEDSTVMAITGHVDPKTFQKYAHLRNKHLLDAVNKPWPGDSPKPEAA